MFYLICLILNFQAFTLPNVNSKIDYTRDIYESSLNAYKKNEFWGDWYVPIGKIKPSATRTSTNIIYSVKNLSDYNLNTAWVAGNEDSGVGEFFEITLNYPKNSGFLYPGQFNGVCGLFNGYCKSLDTWRQNCRVKKMLVYYNNTPLCYINVLDTWHFQSFNISVFFKNTVDKKNLKAMFGIKNGDKLKFEIIEIYKGSKFNDLAISEFLGESADN